MFTGIVLALLASYSFTGAVLLYFVGTLIEKTVTMELAPVLTGLALAGRVGANIAAELGTMRVTEQIDALETLAYDPYAYLVVPRVLAGTLMFPIIGSRVLILTMHPEEDFLVPLLEAGAAGYLVKSAADRELVDAVRAVANGDVYVRPAAARVLAKRLNTKDPHQEDRERFERLTEREQDVLRLTAQGYSAPEIGARLLISPKTVDTYKQRISEKVGVSHRADYVQMALRLGLLARD